MAATRAASLSAAGEGDGVVQAHLVDEAVQGVAVGGHGGPAHHLEWSPAVVVLARHEETP